MEIASIPSRYYLELYDTGFLSPGPSSFPGTCSFPYFGLFSGCQDWVSLLYFCLSGQVIFYILIFI